MICLQCGNAILTQTILTGLDAQICLVCQHTGRAIECMENYIAGYDPAKPDSEQAIMEIRSCTLNAAELQAKCFADSLDAVYGAISASPTPEQEVEHARAVLASRIANPCHGRERPHWDVMDQEQAERDRDRQPVCQSCLGTGRYGNRRCPDCYEPDERE